MAIIILLHLLLHGAPIGHPYPAKPTKNVCQTVRPGHAPDYYRFQHCPR